MKNNNNNNENIEFNNDDGKDIKKILTALRDKKYYYGIYYTNDYVKKHCVGHISYEEWTDLIDEIHSKGFDATAEMIFAEIQKEERINKRFSLKDKLTIKKPKSSRERFIQANGMEPYPDVFGAFVCIRGEVEEILNKDKFTFQNQPLNKDKGVETTF